MRRLIFIAMLFLAGFLLNVSWMWPLIGVACALILITELQTALNHKRENRSEFER